MTETEYLLESEKNAERLKESIKQLKQSKGEDQGLDYLGVIKPVH